MAIETETLSQDNEQALRALGVDPSTVAWRSARGESGPPDEQASIGDDIVLSDAAWDKVAPLLPTEAPQASAMPNRVFLEAVLAAMQRGGAWTTRAAPTADIEAVRRRFGRWAHQGIFQALADALPRLAVDPEHARLIALAGRRAACLKARARR
jgi:hypothetical protein